MKLEAGWLSFFSFWKKHSLGAGCHEVYLRCYDDGKWEDQVVRPVTTIERAVNIQGGVGDPILGWRWVLSIDQVRTFGYVGGLSRRYAVGVLVKREDTAL